MLRVAKSIGRHDLPNAFITFFGNVRRAQTIQPNALLAGLYSAQSIGGQLHHIYNSFFTPFPTTHGCIEDFQQIVDLY